MARAKAAFEKARGTYHPSLVRFSSGIWMDMDLWILWKFHGLLLTCVDYIWLLDSDAAMPMGQCHIFQGARHFPREYDAVPVYTLIDFVVLPCSPLHFKVKQVAVWLNQLPYLACSQFLQMEVVCLNGKSVLVQPMESLHQVKTKVAKALGASAEAVRISCAGQVLCGTASLADALAAFQISEPGPLFGVVDRDRMELSRHLRIFKEDLQACKKQVAKWVDLKTELTRKRRQLCVVGTSFREIDRTIEQLKGTLPLQQEKWLVFRLPKLVRLGDMEETVGHEDFKKHALWRKLENEKIPGLRADLQKALEGSHQQGQLLLEFDEKANFHEEWWDIGCDCMYCCPPDDPPNVLRDLVFLQDLCPRLLHRDLGRNSKRSWKQVPKEKSDQLEPYPCDCSDEWPRLRPLKSKRNQKYNRSAMRHVKAQLSKLSLGHSSEEC